MTTNPGTDTPPVDRPLTAAAATRYQQLRGHLAALRLHTAAEQRREAATLGPMQQHQQHH